MKTRTGFVSNSSSSSFVVNLSKLSPRDIEIVLNYPLVACQEGSKFTDYWNIKRDDERGLIIGNTNMDNSDFSNYLASKEVDQSMFHFEE